MAEYYDVIQACCICHREAEARWCFCRDKNAVYCSSACQHGGWPVHKQVCSWYNAKIEYRRRKNKSKYTNQFSHHHPRNRTSIRADSTQVVNVYLNPQLQTHQQRQQSYSMEDDLCGIRVCIICNQWEEARWCFCRDKKAAYCSIDCQREGWDAHKKECSWYKYKLTSRSQRGAIIQTSESQHSAAQAIQDLPDGPPAPEEIQKLEDNATHFKNRLEEHTESILRLLTVGAGHGHGDQCRVGHLTVRALLMTALQLQRKYQDHAWQLHSGALQHTPVMHQQHLQG